MASRAGRGFVKHLAGSFTGVMGLPVCETTELLKDFIIGASEAGGRLTPPSPDFCPPVWPDTSPGRPGATPPPAFVRGELGDTGAEGDEQLFLPARNRSW